MPSPALRAALGYRKLLPERPPRALVLRADYYVFGDLIEGARELGWSIDVLETPREGRGQGSFLRELLGRAVEGRPDFLLSVNHLGFDEEGALAGLLDDLGLPLASWFVDHPLPILGGAPESARANTQLFCFERSALPWLRDAGFEEPAYLPTAASTRRFHPDAVDAELASELGAPLVFVGGSWWRRAREDFDAGRRARSIGLEERGPVDRQLLRRAPCPELAGLSRRDHDALQVALAERSMRRRRALLETLAPLAPRVHGDEAWRRLLPELDLHPSLDPERALPACFAGSAVNLNVTAEQMPTAVNQRVWEVPAAGGFLLTDDQEDVGLHFELGREAVTYGSPEEALELAQHFLEHRSEREAIATRAFERVEREHRTRHRLLEVERVMRARFGSRMSSVA